MPTPNAVPTVVRTDCKLVSPESVISIIANAPTVHSTSVKTDSRLRMVSTLFDRLIFLDKATTITELLPPTMAPNSSPFNRRHPNNTLQRPAVTTTFNVHPTTANMTARELLRIASCTFMFRPASKSMMMRANEAKKGVIGIRSSLFKT